jgi:hypothetical protein
MDTQPDDIIWTVRLFIYQHITEEERPPTVAETAARFQLSMDRAGEIYAELHQRHALFLDPGTAKIRIANPYSAIPTSFRVHTHEHSYWANCAWDALGIPAMLGAEARIETGCADNQQAITIAIEQGQIQGDAGVIHFPLPFARWYDDLIFT